jgi:hypothetical protein
MLDPCPTPRKPVEAILVPVTRAYLAYSTTAIYLRPKSLGSKMPSS